MHTKLYTACCACFLSFNSHITLWVKHYYSHSVDEETETQISGDAGPNHMPGFKDKSVWLQNQPSKRFCHIAPPMWWAQAQTTFSQTHTQSTVSWLQWPESTLLAKATRLPGENGQGTAGCSHLPLNNWATLRVPGLPLLATPPSLTLDNQWLATPCRNPDSQNFNSLLSKKVIANPQHPHSDS